MEELLPDVFVVPANGRQGYGYSHFVRHPAGNVLLPRLKAASLSDAFDALARRGGVKRVLISDRHFGGPGCAEAAARFGAVMHASTVESAAIAARCRVDSPIALERQTLGGYIDAIPTPGHTPGQLAFLLTVRHQRCLFTGDFVRRVKGRWEPGNRRRSAMKAGLDQLRSLEVDYVIGCADYDEAGSFVEVGGALGPVVDAMLAACTEP